MRPRPTRAPRSRRARTARASMRPSCGRSPRDVQVTKATYQGNLPCNGLLLGSTKEVSMRFSDSHHFRRMVAGCCMVAGPLLALVASVVSPAFHTDAGDQLASVAANQDRFLASALISMLAIALILVAALGLMHMLRERMVAYGHAGGGFAVLGLVAYTAQIGFLLTQWQMVR